MPTLKFRNPADGKYVPILGGGSGGGGDGTNEVSIAATAPGDGSELWLRHPGGALFYRNPTTLVYDPVASGAAEDHTVQAGAGLTGGGVISGDPVLNVGQGAGITVSGDAVAVNKATLDSWYAPMNGHAAVQITDWNQAVLNNTAYMAIDAANGPDSGWWYGTVISHNAAYKHQLLFPFANGRWNSAQMFERELEGGVWGDWNRVPQYFFSRDVMDSMTYAQHNANGSALGIRRFAWGMYKDKTNNNATGNDQFRVQCYDTGGTYTWSGIIVAESGAVSFPKGHSLVRSQMDSQEPVQAAQAATVGMVVELVVRLMQRAGITVDPAEVISLIEEPVE